MYRPKYALFYDNHTMPHCPDVGKGFDVERFVDRIEKCGVDYLIFHARCNLGMSYYDTDIGIKHPSLEYDLFGRIADVCQRKGIALTAYLNAGISSAEGVKHPEWNRVSFDGRIHAENKVDPYVRTMCFNSGYHDHLVAMVAEIAGKYKISGFFLDCFGWPVCTCKHCIREMKKLGINWGDAKEVRQFGKKSALRLATDIRNAGNEINPDFLFYFNGLGYEEQKEIGSYLECECLPTAPNWGYEFLPLAARYMRTIGNQPLLNMTARFYDWADFGGIRSAEAIKFELLTGLALGLRPNIGSHIHPRGDFEDPVFDLVENVYGYLQEREAWYSNAECFAEIAIVFTNDCTHFSAKEYLKGATRMLSELQLQFDVVSDTDDLSKYKLIILPDEIIISKKLAEKIKCHIDNGKSVISTGESGLSEGKDGFELEKYWGVRFKGNCKYDPAFIKVNRSFIPDLVDMPLSLYSQGIEMEAYSEEDVNATLFKPYYNKHWDGEYAVFYTPPDSNTNIPALVIHNNVAQFSHKIFTGYYERGSIELRTFLDWTIKQFLPNPIIKTENLPSFARAIVTRQVKEKRTVVHVISYLPELRGKTQIIEEPITLLNVKIFLKIGNACIRNVYLAPQRTSLDFKFDGEYMEVNIPRIDGYGLLIFEEEEK